MKTNKISAMLLSAAIACTPVLTSVAQIAASAEDATAEVTTDAAVAETTAVQAAEAAVAVPVAIDPAAAVVAAAETDPEPTPTEAPTEKPAEKPTEPAKQTVNAADVNQGAAAFNEKSVDQKEVAANAQKQDMSYTIAADPIINAVTRGVAAAASNPNFNPFDPIYSFRVPNTNEGKMLYTPNPRWFVNTPTPACVGGSGSTATITWDPVPMADGYRYSIRTWVMQPDADSHDYAFAYTQGARDNTGAKSVTPVTTTYELVDATGAKTQFASVYKVDMTVQNLKDKDGNDTGKTVQGYELTADKTAIKTEDGKAVVKYVKDDKGNKVYADDLINAQGQNVNQAGEVVQRNNKINDNYINNKFDPIFRVKEGLTINGKYQPQDDIVSAGQKSGCWREFKVADRDLVTGYCYDLEHPSVSVQADVPVRIEIMIQAFRIDNATGNIYNMSDVSTPRVVDLNWVAGESWEGYAGMPDQKEDELFRAEYHTLSDKISCPNEYEMTWSSVTLPVTKKMVDDGVYTLGAGEHVDDYTGYVVKPAEKQMDDPKNKDAKIDVETVVYATAKDFKEKISLKGLNWETAPTMPALFDVSDTLLKSGEKGAQRWAINTSANQALKDDYDRKVKAYNEWKRVNVTPISDWNKKYADNVAKAWRIAYKEAIKAYAASEYSSDKRFSMRYGLLDLDRNGTPELIVSFSSKADKNSYVVIDFQADRAKLRTVKDANYTEWYYEDVLAGCARRGRCFKLDNLAPIDDWTPASDDVDPLATTSSSSSSASSSASSSSGSSSSSSASASTDGAPKTGDAGVAGLAAVAFASVAGMFASCRRKKN